MSTAVAADLRPPDDPGAVEQVLGADGLAIRYATGLKLTINGHFRIYRLQGDLMNATGDRAAADRNYRHALAVAERRNAKSLELRAATSLARLWGDQGKRGDARALLAAVYGWFTEGFDTPVLKEAKELLEQLSA